MLGPVARSRALAGAAALLTLVGASAVLGVGSSSASGGTSRAAAAAAPFVGPVAAAVPPRPLLRTDGPLLLPAGTARVAPVVRPLGPRPTAGAATVGPPALVGLGSAVPAIRTVQRRLNVHGAQLRVDGAWGPATTRAVERLQAQAGLPVDGRVGPRTAAVLRR
jgi:peptidoglycan hydrolase-like protein with peptidoglycan-binding domain